MTLIELAVTVVILAVLIAVAVPAFRGQIQRQRISSAYNNLLASLQYARTEAVMRGVYVAVCPSINGSSCSTSTAYETGWLVYSYPVSAGLNQAPTVTGATLLRVNAAATGVSMQAVGTDPITFGQQGQIKVAAGAAARNVQFVVCARTGATGTGQNTTTAPGALLTLSASGGLMPTKLASTATCTP